MTEHGDSIRAQEAAAELQTFISSGEGVVVVSPVPVVVGPEDPRRLEVIQDAIDSTGTSRSTELSRNAGMVTSRITSIIPAPEHRPE